MLSCQPYGPAVSTSSAPMSPSGVAAAAAFLCLQVRHQARNNLGAEVFDALEQALGAMAAAGAPLPPALAGLSGGGVAGGGEGGGGGFRVLFYTNLE
ncbi:hypothetical protein BXO454_20105, partial [Xanthomonas oryzae pv. oryzae]